MAKSIGKFMGVGNNSTSAYGSEKDILKYLNEYDTSQADSAYKNMASLGNQLSSQLSERPDYIYSVNASDDEAKRIENATYQNAVSKIAPQFESQQRQLETKLQNQGISPGSEAYNSAMNNLMAQQNNAYVQAAFDSISITVDTQMSDSSTNAVQNKIIKNYVDTTKTNLEQYVDNAIENQESPTLDNATLTNATATLTSESTAVTQDTIDNSTKIATTKFVKDVVGNLSITANLDENCNLTFSIGE